MSEPITDPVPPPPAARAAVGDRPVAEPDGAFAAGRVPATRARVGSPSTANERPRRAAWCAALLPFFATGGCAWVGPAALGAGRDAYNTVVDDSEDRQVLAALVQHRYGETFGLLSVASITASLRIGVSAGANAGIGPRSGYEGNLVPLSVGAVYEESPTITYVPLQGAEFLQRMLAPITAEQLLLLNRLSGDRFEVLRLLVRRVNGLANPLYAAAGGDGFDRFVELQAKLREQGKLDFVSTPAGEFQMLVHDHGADDRASVDEMLRVVGVVRDTARPGAIVVPVRFFVGEAGSEHLDLETPTALEALGAAAAGVEVPEQHLHAGIASVLSPERKPAFLRIHCATTLPDHVMVAVAHHGHWFFVDARDAVSKRSFVLLRTLIGLRMDREASARAAPILTVPVAR